MKNKLLSRLGATVGAVVLLLTGLVGFAAPANAFWGEPPNEYKLHNDNGISSIYMRVVANSSTYNRDKCAEAARLYAEEKYGPLKPGNGRVYGYNTPESVCSVAFQKMPTAEECEAKGQVLNEVQEYGQPSCRDKTEQEKQEECEAIDDAEWENGVCWEVTIPLGPEVELCPDGGIVNGNCVPEAELPIDINCDWDAGEQFIDGEGCVLPKAPIVDEPVQKDPPPPPCWSGEAGNNCPVGGALRFAAPEYAMVGVPITMYAYASWRPDENSPAQPTNGTAVIRVDGEDYSGVEFKDGIAEWRFIPETEGMKEFTASGVVFSGLSGASAYIDTVPARTYVLEYDPAAYATAFKNKAVEIGEKYVITDPNQARSYLEGRYEWRVADKSEDVCAVYETKKGAVKAKFNEAGQCKVIWTDTESGDTGKFTFIAEK